MNHPWIAALVLMGFTASALAQGDRAAAQQEYDAALAAYNSAVKSLGSARASRSYNQTISPYVVPGKAHNVWEALGKAGAVIGSSDIGVSQAEAEVETARARLDRAREYLYSFDQRNIARDGRDEININNVVSPTPRSSSPVSHPNVVQLADGKCRPENGYTWVAPNDPNDFRVKPIEVPKSTTLWDAYTSAAISANNKKNYREAQELLEKAVSEAEKLGPNNPRLGMTLFWLGINSAAMEKEYEAEAFFKKSLEIMEAQKNAQSIVGDILGRLSRIERRRENFALAEAFSKKATGILRENAKDKKGKDALADELFHLARLYNDSNDTDKEVAVYRELIDLAPDNPIYRCNLAANYMKLGKTESAKAEYDKMLSLKPDEPMFYLIRADAFFAKTGDFTGACRDYDKCIELAPDFIDAHFKRAEALILTGDSQAAQSQLARLCDAHQNSTNPATVNAIAWNLCTSPVAGIRNGARAVQMAERTVQLDGRSNPATLDTLAAAYAEAGRFAEAVASQKEAISKLTVVHAMRSVQKRNMNVTA